MMNVLSNRHIQALIQNYLVCDIWTWSSHFRFTHTWFTIHIFGIVVFQVFPFIVFFTVQMWILSVTILIMIRKYCTSYDCVKTAYCPMYFNSSTQCSQSQTVTIPQSSGTRLHICHQVSLRKLMGMTHLLGSTTKINSSN